jgi:eukaryotic translation initiation factor 2C
MNHVDGKRGFKIPNLPTNSEDFKALIPKRRNPGTLSQRKVHIAVNFFSADITLPKQFYRYEVDITKIFPKREEEKEKAKGRGAQSQEPKPPNKDLRVKIFKLLVSRIRADWHANNPKVNLGLFHDFSRIMVTTSRLESTVDLEYVVEHRELEDEDDSDVSYCLNIRQAELNLNIPRLQGILNNLQNFNEPDESDLAIIEQFYNILLKNIGGDMYLPLGRNSLMKIPVDEYATNLGAGLCNWQGVTAIYTMGTSWKPYINIEIQNSAFRIGQPVDEAVRNILSGDRNIRLNDVTNWRDHHYDAVLDLLRSCKVTRTVGGRRYDGVVRDVLRKPLSAVSKFKCEELNNDMVTLAEYYRRRYNINIRNSSGLVLQIGQKALVPSELCTIKKGQSYNRMLTNENVTKTMLTMATQKPDVKELNINRAIQDLQMNQNSLLQDFGVNFNDELLQLKETRVLSAPELCYGVASSGRREQGAGIPSRGRIMPQNGEWDQWSHNVQFFKPIKIHNWAVLILDDDRSNPTRFISELRRNGENIGGMGIPEPSTVIYRGDISERGNAAQNIDSITKILRNLKDDWSKQNLSDMKSFVLVMIPRKGCSLYNQVKQAAELNVGVLTQCVIQKNMDNANHSVVKNILLKVNCKLGGINHVTIIPKHLNEIDILRTPVMIIGIDVNHPSPGQGNKIPQPSFAAVTASIDRSGMPYMMHVQAQIKAERGAAEVVQNLHLIIFEMLKTFFVTTKKAGRGIKPSKIIVYRDGVGTSQFPEVLHIEMRAIRRACEKLKDDDGNPYRPKITIIAVQKRHKVRFFLKTNGRTENAPPGTVVDTEIVNSDFYLQSHKGMLGTSRPTHYQVLWDDSDFSSDEIQALSYYLCYMYSRCNKAVSYPAPTYYAHWAAKRANALCKTGSAGSGKLPSWWDGSADNLDRLNAALRRNVDVTAGFPMHFV